jgi:hypothetical protein
MEVKGGLQAQPIQNAINHRRFKTLCKWYRTDRKPKIYHFCDEKKGKVSDPTNMLHRENYSGSKSQKKSLLNLHCLSEARNNACIKLVNFARKRCTDWRKWVELLLKCRMRMICRNFGEVERTSIFLTERVF